MRLYKSMENFVGTVIEILDFYMKMKLLAFHVDIM